jgi:ABC-type nitrate/sulfonate/bicarbonate transport system substrate-binding protein
MASLLTLTACGGNDSEQASEGGPTEVRVLIPAESPIEYPHRVAEAEGYFEEEGIESTYQYAGGSSEVIQQLVAGNGDIGVTCASAIVDAYAQGFTQVRPVFTTVYGSIFGMAVPEDSDVQDPADLEGQTIGISDPAGGEVPIVRGILKAAGLSEQDVELLPIGEGTAVALKAIKDGKVDAVGGSFSDFVALRVQGLALRPVGADTIEDLPACGVVVTNEYLQDNREVVEGFLRGSAKGVVFGQNNPDATLEILREASPDGFKDDLGTGLVELYMPLMAPPEGAPIGEITADSYQSYIDFVGAEAPEEDLSDLINDDLIEPANEFDVADVEADAQN